MLHRTRRKRAAREGVTVGSGTGFMLGFLGVLLLAAVMPAAATSGARCPASTGVALVTPQYANGLLRCQRIAIAPPTCPPTHLDYEVLPGADTCRLARNVAPTGLRTTPPLCPANMDRVIDAGASSRDQCRGRSEFVPPLLGDF